MSPAERADRVLQVITPRLKAEGYTVLTRPASRLLPDFMRGYRPDAVALGAPRNIAIAVAQDAASPPLDAAALSARFAGVPDWEFRIVYAPESLDDRPVPSATRADILEALDRAEALAAAQPEAALVLAWAALEAFGRLALPGDTSRPQPAGQLVERLADQGLVTADEADRLRDLAETRNLVAHGALRAVVPSSAVEEVASVLRAAIEETDAAP